MKTTKKMTVREAKKLASYKRRKKQILHQLGIECDVAAERHLLTLENEIQVDNFAHSLILANS